MKTHRNLPFFVPHAGCPHCCVFCSQTKITGERVEKDIGTELSELRSLLESEKGEFRESQIAFFGGSFTAIERERMEKLLSLAREYIKKGAASSVRISTRPDKIDESVLDLLKNYDVTNIELGVQSTDNTVLDACERGHSAEDSFNAAKMIIDKGFVFGGQMMVGLPGSTLESELKTARDIVKMGAKEARIYPTVVFEGTKLFDMAVRGEYVPLSLEDAVERTAKCARIFIQGDVKILRMGLHSSENLASAPMGANHPGLGELVKSRIYTDIIADMAGNCKNKILSINIRSEDISMLRGYNSAAISLLKLRTGAEKIEIIPSDLPRFRPSITTRRV